MVSPSDLCLASRIVEEGSWHGMHIALWWWIVSLIHFLHAFLKAGCARNGVMMNLLCVGTIRLRYFMALEMILRLLLLPGSSMLLVMRNNA